MKCNCNCKTCDRMIFSAAVTFTGGNLVINIPDGNYGNGCKYCIVITDTIPTETTIGAPVVVTIGEGTVQYPLLKCNGVQATAGAIRTRYRYPVIVRTNTTSGAFRMLCGVPCAPDDVLASLPAPAAAAAPAGDGA